MLYTLFILAFLFAAGSFIGWLIEVPYRRFIDPTNPERKWLNPGFFNGPYLPIYGFALIILYLLAMIEPYLTIGTDWLRKGVLFLVMAMCITAMEYFGGMIFIVKLNIKLWDYSSNRFNIKGIICPLYSFYWVLLSAFYYFILSPIISGALDWISRNQLFSFVVGFFYGILAVDIIITTRDMIKIREFALENRIVIMLDELKMVVLDYKERTKEKALFFLPLRSTDTIRNQLMRYKERSRALTETFDKYKIKLTDTISDTIRKK